MEDRATSEAEEALGVVAAAVVAGGLAFEIPKGAEVVGGAATGGATGEFASFWTLLRGWRLFVAAFGVGCWKTDCEC